MNAPFDAGSAALIAELRERAERAEADCAAAIDLLRELSNAAANYEPTQDEQAYRERNIDAMRAARAFLTEIRGAA